MSIYFLVLNMNKNPERYENITSMLNKTGCLFSRIEAIDGSSIEYNKDCKQIFKLSIAGVWDFPKLFLTFHRLLISWNLIEVNDECFFRHFTVESPIDSVRKQYSNRHKS